ncbi:MAG: GGDEF domain-containing protein [Candidatus Omnitrophica bacterium]|nr:GGDEF domain-containing protein [Candidatus Omnitrophota bacterium]
MFSAIIVGLFVVSLYIFFTALNNVRQRYLKNLSYLENDLNKKRERFTALARQISQKEERTHNILKLYEINRKLAPLLNVEDLTKVFLEELRRIREINRIYFSKEPPNKENSLSFYFENLRDDQYLYVQCEDKDLKSQLPYLIASLKLLINRAYIYEKIQKISITDSLTNIANKRYFMSRYEEEFNRSEKFGLELSFLMIDIDHFKTYNDNHGHLVGDIILRELAGVVKENIREIDFMGRFGGEEFSVFLPQTAKEQALQVAERLRETAANTEFNAYDETVKLTISIGIASFPSNAKDKDLLIDTADRSLYKAKQEGRNRVCSL